MSVSESQINFILDQLKSLKPVNAKRMFGGVGFFKDQKMFGMLNGEGVFLLKVDDSNRKDYIEKGMAPFSHSKNKKGNMPYFEVPVSVIENSRELCNWAAKSFEIAKKK